MRVDELFAAVAAVRDQLSAGLLAMVSMSIVQRLGMKAFAERAADCGFDRLIVPDVPVDECGGLAQIAESCGLCNVLMSAPTSSDQRRRRIAELSTGFIYLIAAKGITGERDRLAGGLAEDVKGVRAMTKMPLIVGFGINTPAQVREVCRVADGVIVGSAIIRRITTGIDEQRTADEIVDAIGSYVDELITGTNDSDR